MSAIAAFVGRIFLAVIFIVSGAGKLFDPAGTEAMITGVGLPAGLAIPTGVFELVAGLALALGFMTRLFAILLAGFCLVTAMFFHNQFQDPMQAAMALKNLAIAGGLLCLFAHSQMRWSYDSMRLTRKSEIARRDADAKIHEAELRVVKAEAEAEALRSVPHVVPVAAPVVTPVAAPVAAPAPMTETIVDRDRDNIDDRIQRALDRTPRVDANRNRVDDRDEPIDPRIRP